MLLTIIIVHSDTHSAVISLHAVITPFCMESISIHIIGIPRPHLSTMTYGQSPNNIIFIVRVLRKNIYTVSYKLHACSVFFANVIVIYRVLKPLTEALRYSHFDVTFGVAIFSQYALEITTTRQL